MEKIIHFLKEKGLKVVKKTNEIIDKTKNKVKDNMLNEQLRRRFQLENPHKMMITEKRTEVNLIQEITASHAKIYEEDYVFVFFGNQVDNHVEKGYFIKDLATLEQYVVKDIVEVEIPVTLNNKIYDVLGTAVYCEEA